MAGAPPPLPDRSGAIALALSLLRGMAEEVPAEGIDQVWIFPERESGEIMSSILVASLFVPGDEGRREIMTTHLITRRGKAPGPRKGTGSERPEILRQGIVPVDRVERLVAGVMRRLDHELAALTPRLVSIGGDTEVWARLVSEFEPTEVS